jgi:hypothetical protein
MGQMLPANPLAMSAKVGLGVAARFHAVADRVDRLRRVDRPALALIVLDVQREKIEAIGFWRAQLRFISEALLGLFERSVVVGVNVVLRTA